MSGQFAIRRQPKVLDNITGKQASGISVLPLNILALPGSVEGKQAVTDLRAVCIALQPHLRACLEVASLQGASAKAFIVAWQRLNIFRVVVLDFVLVLLEAGFNAGPMPATWIAAVKAPFAELIAAAERYQDAHDAMCLVFRAC